MLLGERIEIGIRFVFCTESVIRHLLFIVILDQPEIGMDRLLIYILILHGCAAAAGNIGKDIRSSCILEELRHVTVTTSNEPGITKLLFGKYSWLRLHVCRQNLHGQIMFLSLVEDGISHLLFSQQKTVETNPFGTSERCRFHVIRSFDDGNSHLFHRAVTSIFERRSDDSFRLMRNHHLHIG